MTKRTSPTTMGQELLTSIVESTDDAIISRTLDGRILTWNRGAERLYGHKASKVVGKHIGFTFPKDFPPDIDDINEKLRRGERLERYVTTRRRKDGRELVVDLTISPLHGPDGELTAVAIIARDITYQNMLMNRQREFVSIASHELRTPLTALTGYLALAQSTKDSVQANEFIGRAFMAAQRLTKLVEDLLEVAKLEEERVVLDVTEFNPTRILKEAIDELGLPARQKQLELRFKNDLTARDRIKADPVKFHQVLRNLLENAVKYTQAGGRVSVTARPAAGLIRIRVRDTGIGIDEKNLDKIFNKFFREYTELSVHAGGTGLGLFITKQLVDRMGGSLNIRSRRKTGTVVTVTFPLVPARRQRTSVRKRPSAKRRGATMRKKK
ncbi:MAG: PAS domain-containing sensor histidine kinase [bacterium]|nr:PAS domain-containing sensor histidine kinase [bacterium]